MTGTSGTSPSPSTRRASGEARWPAVLCILAISGLQFALPAHLRLGPSWLMLAVVTALEVPIFLAHRAGRHRANQKLAYVVLVLITGALLVSLARLISSVLTGDSAPRELLMAAAGLWFSNILTFAVWYWRLDAGGPYARGSRHFHAEGAFVFPPMTMDARLLETFGLQHWRPHFVDYLYLSFNTSTALSPSDTPALSGWAKLLAMVQALISLSTIGILAARAVNELGR